MTNLNNAMKENEYRKETGLIKEYFLFKFNDPKEVKQFYDEIASAYFPNFELFKAVYRRVTNVDHNFLLIDNDTKNEELK